MDIKKKIQNIWFYYKVPIIIGIFILAVFIDYQFTSTPEEKFDHSIALISQTFPTEQQSEEIKQIFSDKYGGTFEIRIYNVALGELNQDQVIISQLDLDLANRQSEYLLIEDLDAFKKATNELELHEVTLVSDLDWLVGHGVDSLYFAKR